MGEGGRKGWSRRGVTEHWGDNNRVRICVQISAATHCILRRYMTSEFKMLVAYLCCFSVGTGTLIDSC